MSALLMILISYYFMSKLFIFLLIMISFKKRERRINAEYVNDNILQDLGSSVTAIVPFFNESSNLLITIDSLLNQDINVEKIILSDDGSSNKLYKQVCFTYDLKFKEEVEVRGVTISVYTSKINKNLILLRSERLGKAECLNLASDFTTTKYMFFTDADCYLDSSAIRKMIVRTHLNRDTIAVGATIRIINGQEKKLYELRRSKFKNNLLTMFQELEYIVSFIVGRSAMNIFDSCFILSGACYLIRKREFVLCGGFSSGHRGEDLELTLKIFSVFKKKNSRSPIDFVDEPLCWTDAPHSLGHLYAQRVRWHQGLVQCLWSYFQVFTSRSSGIKRMVLMNSYLAFESFSCIFDLISIFAFSYLYNIGLISGSFILKMIFANYLVDIVIILFGVNLYQMQKYSGDRSIEYYHYFLLLLLPVIYKPIILVFEIIGILKGVISRKEGNKSWGVVRRAEGKGHLDGLC